MRLLNTLILTLEDNVDVEKKYAILSHRWTKGEVLYEDLKAGTGMKKAGFHKLAQACQVAAEAGYGYIWIDTCCIDKSSSTELSEAINSMFTWYRDAAECYVYLADFDCVPFRGSPLEFHSSEWFVRGWTLQELIAPRNVTFYSRQWTYLGQKQDLCTELARITGIDEHVLGDVEVDLSGISIAKRMSWAAKRHTTRPEDMAYCLLGIFDVNMPLLYGEGGKKAFYRLQEEIMKISPDQSIFAWSPSEQDLAMHSPSKLLGVLAEHPSRFAQASEVIPFVRNDAPYAMANNGLQICLPTIAWQDMAASLMKSMPQLSAPSEQSMWAVLSCHKQTDIASPLAIALSTKNGSDS